MKTLLNFAHPLSEKATKQIKEEVGEFIKEIIVECQLDLSGDERSLCGQVADIEAGDHNVRLQDADMFIAPALSSAAAILTRDHLISMRPAPLLVWLKKEGSPPEFVLGGIE